MLIPPTIDGEERLTFIAAQRERLSILLSALDKEAANLPQTSGQKARLPSMSIDGSSEEEVGGNGERPKSAMSGLSTRRSEADFENIDAESGTEEVESGRRRVVRGQSGGGGSWMPWSWGAKAAVESEDTVMGEDKGKSSGVDA